MEFLSIIKLAMSVFGKGSFVLKSPGLLASITKIVAATVVLIQACSGDATNEQKLADATAVILLSIDLAEEEFGNLPDETNKFIKETLVPDTITLVVGVFNALKIFGKKTTPVVPVVNTAQV